MNDVKVKILGSVSPYCKDNKNCPGYLIECNNHRILLDCGSGTTRLLDMNKDLNNLIIIISHLHKDHYSDLGSIGYASYVQKRLGNLTNEIKVYIPSDINKPDYDYLMNFGKTNCLNFITYDASKTITHDKMTINFAENPHPVLTYSSSIEIDNKKIVYSADTGYENNTLEQFASNADLFICESTYLRNQPKNGDNHLYAYEAGMIAKNANVKKLLLTHFYPEIDKNEYLNEAKGIFENTDVAEEGKILTLRG